MQFMEHLCYLVWSSVVERLLVDVWDYFRLSWKAHALLLRNKLRWQQSSHVTLIKEAPQYRVDPNTRKRRKFMGIWKGTGSICLQ